MAKRRLWQLAILVGFVIHAVGAVTVLPTAKDMPDFGAYYVAAWGVRSGLAIYDWPKTVEAAVAAGLPMAAKVQGYRVDYPPLFSFLLVPLTFLPYRMAQVLWAAILLAVLFLSAWLLTELLGGPFWLILVISLTFSPFTLALAWGNVSPVLLLGALVLAKSLVSRKPQSIWSLFPFALVSSIKLFPAAWVMVPLLGRRWDSLKKLLILACIIGCLTVLLSPALTLDFWRNLRESENPLAGRVGEGVSNNQTNIVGFIAHLTQPALTSYDRFGISRSEKVINPWVSLPMDTVRVLAWGAMLLATVIILIVSWRLIARGLVVQALWFFIVGLLLVQPFTLYHYLILLLPGLLYLARSSNRRLSWLALLAYILLGAARFVALITAILSSSLFMLTGHIGIWAMLLIEIGICWSTRQDAVVT